MNGQSCTFQYFLLSCFFFAIRRINKYVTSSFPFHISVDGFRVVPGMLLTITLSSLRILFINDDLPVFGFPTTATFIASPVSSDSSFSGSIHRWHQEVHLSQGRQKRISVSNYRYQDYKTHILRAEEPLACQPCSPRV